MFSSDLRLQLLKCNCSKGKLCGAVDEVEPQINLLLLSAVCVAQRLSSGRKDSNSKAAPFLPGYYGM